MPNRLWILISLLIAAGLGGVYYYFSIQPIKEIQQFTGLKEEARDNSFYIAQRLFEKFDVKVEAISAYAELPDNMATSATLLLNTEPSYLNEKQVEGLLQWVENGGHVILAAGDNIKRVNNHFFDTINIDVIEYAEEETESTTSSTYETKITDLENISYWVDFFSWHSLIDYDDKAVWVIGDEYDTYGLQMPWGDGVITVLTSIHMFDNYHITDYDHARFLHKLINNTPDNSSELWIQYGVSNIPSLWSIIWSNAQMIIISCVILIIGFLWYSMPRFGPIISIYSDQRRSLVEHLEATGKYYVKTKQLTKLLRRVITELFNEIKYKHPQWKQFNKQQKNNLLQQLGNISQSSAQQLLEHNELRDEHSFINAIKSIENIRKSL